jgi:heme oxygenase
MTIDNNIIYWKIVLPYHSINDILFIAGTRVRKSMAAATTSNGVPQLTERINMATKMVHEQSGKAIDWKLSLILTSRTCYCEAISLFYIIYREIEFLYQKHVPQNKALQLLQPVVTTFQRSKKFEQDIYFLMPTKDEARKMLNQRSQQVEVEVENNNDNDNTGEDQKTTINKYDPPELQNYIDNMHTRVNKDPVVLIAYLYTMYGAITGGGVAIQKMVQRAFGLKTKDGVQIFELNLDTVEKNPKGFKSGREVWKEFKRIVDEDVVVLLSDDEIQLILREAPTVFIGNNALVSTVQRTRAFGKAAVDCTKRIGVSLAVAVAIIATIAFYSAKDGDKPNIISSK